MGATDAKTIINLGLRKIGQKAISNLGDPTDAVAVKANDVYVPLLKQLLREHPWNFAKFSAVLGHVVDTQFTITGATQANPVVITTSSAHGFTAGETVAIREVVGMTILNGRKFTVGTVLSSTTLELSGEDGTSSDYLAYVSGGTIGEVSVVPTENDYSCRYDLPDNFLRLVKVNGEPADQIDHSIESGASNLEFLTDEPTAAIKFIKYVSDTTTFDDTFVSLFAWLIAAELCYTISQSRTLAVGLREQYEKELAKAKGINAQAGGTPRQIRQNDVIDARE